MSKADSIKSKSSSGGGFFSFFTSSSSEPKSNRDAAMAARAQERESRARQRRQQREEYAMRQEDRGAMMSCASSAVTVSQAEVNKLLREIQNSNELGMCASAAPVGCGQIGMAASAAQSSEMDELERRLAALSDSPPRTMARSAPAPETSYKSSARECSAAEEKSSVKISIKPRMALIIQEQHHTGYWPADKRTFINDCIVGTNKDDSKVMQSLKNLGTIEMDKISQLYTTLLAIFVLTKVYSNEKSTWQLLVEKAKTYLKQAGVAKPEKLLKQFSLKLIK